MYVCAKCDTTLQKPGSKKGMVAFCENGHPIFHNSVVRAFALAVLISLLCFLLGTLSSPGDVAVTLFIVDLLPLAVGVWLLYMGWRASHSKSGSRRLAGVCVAWALGFLLTGMAAIFPGILLIHAFISASVHSLTLVGK